MYTVLQRQAATAHKAGNNLLVARLHALRVQLARIRAVPDPLHASHVALDGMSIPLPAIRPQTASPVQRAHTHRAAAMWRRRTAPSVPWDASQHRQGARPPATATTVRTASIRARRVPLRASHVRRDASRQRQQRCHHAACVRQVNIKVLQGHRFVFAAV